MKAWNFLIDVENKYEISSLSVETQQIAERGGRQTVMLVCSPPSFFSFTFFQLQDDHLLIG